MWSTDRRPPVFTPRPGPSLTLARKSQTLPWTIASRRSIAVGLVLLIVLLVLLVGALPTWPHSRKWGYGPTGGLGLVLVIILVLVLFGAIPRGF